MTTPLHPDLDTETNPGMTGDDRDGDDGRVRLGVMTAPAAGVTSNPDGGGDSGEGWGGGGAPAAVGEEEEGESSERDEPKPKSDPDPEEKDDERAERNDEGALVLPHPSHPSRYYCGRAFDAENGGGAGGGGGGGGGGLGAGGGGIGLGGLGGGGMGAAAIMGGGGGMAPEDLALVFGDALRAAGGDTARFRDRNRAV